MTTITRATERQWQNVGIPGIDKAVFWRNGHGVAMELFRLKKNVNYPEHTHAGWESMYVLKGRIRLSGQELGVGDFVFTEPGETHIAEILDDSVVLLGFGQKA